MAATLVQTDAQTNEEQRTARAFVQFVGTALGLDQSYAASDGAIYSPTGQYQVIGPTGAAIEGVPRSTAQPAAIAQIGGLRITPGMLLLAAIVYFAVK